MKGKIRIPFTFGFSPNIFFTKQWNKLKNYANERGINIIGDLPIYVAEDSSDVWANPEIFNLDENLIPITVSGCPPDAFSKKKDSFGAIQLMIGLLWKRMDIVGGLEDLSIVSNYLMC